jgi:hypothetical protein
MEGQHSDSSGEQHIDVTVGQGDVWDGNTGLVCGPDGAWCCHTDGGQVCYDN